jgi:hypothetical protein
MKTDNNRPPKQVRTMPKLSANSAAKEAGVAKKTLLDAIASGRLTAAKNDKGYWEIEPSELFRVYPKTGFLKPEKPVRFLHEESQKTKETSVLEIEVKMLRERIDAMTAERDRERGQLVDQIEDLRVRLDGAEAERMRINAILTDQRNTSQKPERRGFWERLFSTG